MSTPSILSEIESLFDARVREYKQAKIYLNQNVGAYHFDREAVKELGLNENNPGLGIERDSGDFRQMVGAYRNSERNNSVYGLVGYTPFQAGDFKAGVMAGGVTGYELPVTPVAGLIGSWQGKNLGVNVTVVPDAKVGDHKAYGFTGVQLRHNFK